MADRVKYERLQDLKAAISGRQGIFVYAPVAQQERVGIVKGSDSITVGADGSLEVSVDAKSKFIQVLNNNTPDDLSQYEGSLFIYQSPGYTDALYKVVNGQLIPTDLELKEVRVSKVTDAGSNVSLIFTDSTISIRINDAEYIFGPTIETTSIPFHYNRSEVDDIVADVVNDIETGVTVAKKAERDSLGNVIKDTYVEKTVYESELGAEVTTRSNADITLQNNINLKADKSQTIIGIDLQDNILLGEFKTALGNATQSLAGLMSATDKARLDALHDLLEEDTSNNVVDSINEILAIFNNYPEGIDIVTALAGKVDKIAGKGLSTNDYSDVEKNKVALSDTHRQATGNPHGTTFAQVNSKPTTIAGYGITDAYTKSYIDSLKDLNGWESELITLTPLTNGQTVTKATLQGFDNIKLFARNTSTNEIDTDSFDTALGLVDGYKYIMFDNAGIYLTIGTNCTFTTIAGYELSIIGQKYTPLTADKVAYGTSDVEEALDSLLVPTYVTATHEALQTEITATDTFEINDETGDVVKITGTGPTNLIVNGDFSNGLTGWTGGYNAALSIENGYLKVIKNVASNISVFQMNTPTGVIGDKYFYCMDIKTSGTDYFVYAGIYNTNGNTSIVDKTTSMRTSPTYTSSNGVFSNFTRISSLNTLTEITNPNATVIGIATSGAQNSIYYIDNIKLYNVSDMIRKGIKADDGRLLSALTDTELELQMNTWMTNGFPTVVEKLVSKSDNLFNAEFKTLSSLESENLIPNGNFVNGLGSFVPYDLSAYQIINNKIRIYGNNSNPLPRVTVPVNVPQGTTTYITYSLYSNSTTHAKQVRGEPNPYTNFENSVSPNYGNRSFVTTAVSNITTIMWFLNGYANPAVIPSTDYFEVGDIKLFNITDLVSRGILPSGLSNAEYKEMIDKAMFTNVPLRETNYIAVEPSKAYKLIKVSTNAVTHKVVEYTTDNQVVKVTPVVYTTNKFTFTTHALTSKIKLVSDLMKRPVRYDVNGDLQNGLTGYTYIQSWRDVLSITNSKLRVTCNNIDGNLGIYLTTTQLKANNEYYLGVRDFYTPKTTPLSLRFNPLNGNPIFSSNDKSMVFKLNYNSNTTGLLYFNADFAVAVLWQVGEYYEFKAINTYNITDFKKAGVVNDSGTLFSRLTNDEIKDQMDIWTEVGFPDHVIAALYPNGVDSAIALKYNDADDVFRPQQIDELPLNLTLRSGEYWQDGYVVKQNGNAEYYPLNTKFSAWNYGQLEAVYTSGVPADFDIRYAQNTAGQVKTTQEYLVEAREQLDYVTEGYDNLVKKLGDDIFANEYDSYAGITSDTYEYYALEGIKEGNTLAIEGAGQSIQNLLGKSGTINATTTVRGVTVTYNSATGVFTANGTATAGAAFNITLATGMDFGLPVGTPMQLIRYYDATDGGTVNLNGSYIGYVLLGTTVSNRINENSEALYDPYINGSGNLTANHATNKQQLLFQVWKEGIVFNNFKFKIGIYNGLQLRPFILPSGEPAKSNVTVYNRTANMLNMSTALNITDSGLTLTYDPLAQEFLLSGTATATKDISLSATFNVSSGDRLSIKRLYQSGDVTAAGGTLPRIKLVNASNTTIVYNDIYKMTAPEGQTPTPDVSFNTGTAPANATLTLKLGITSGQVFDNYRFRLMIHDKSTDIGYVAYRRDLLGTMSVGVNERVVLEFEAIHYGILEFVADSQSLNLLYADSITDLNKTYLEYNAGIISPNRKISELTARAELIDNPFRNKVIAVWGDSRESNNPTSNPTGVGDQKDTSWPALLAKKLNAKVLNYGLSGGAWAENTVQQDAASAIVNRVQTEDINASADVIIISAMNDFKLASALGSPLPANKDKTTFYGAMRLTYDRLATKYPGKKIVLVLPQKRYDETVNYGGGSYYHYLKAQVEVAKEYGIPIVDLYHNFPNAKPTFYATNMLNDTHFSAVGNEKVAELVARELIGNGNKGDMDLIPPIPTTDGTYTLKVTITGGIPVFTWVV